MELLQQEKYAAAQEKFREAIVRISQLLAVTSHELLIHAKYYDALCSKELNRPDAEKLFSDLIEENEINATVRRAYFQLGNIYFDQKKYNKALPKYRQVDPADLSDDEKAVYDFRLATCYFYQKDFDKARYSKSSGPRRMNTTTRRITITLTSHTSRAIFRMRSSHSELPGNRSCTSR